MTLDELDRLHAESERNSPSPWTVDHARRVRDADRCLTHGVDSLSIVALHNAWPEVSARLRAAEAEVERLRGLVRWFLDGDDHTHEEDCGARGNHDLDVCRNEASQCHNMCEGPHCTCDATEMRDAARAALGKP